MLTVTTCQACKERLITSFHGQETHPDCPSTTAEKTAREFVDAIIREDLPEVHRLEKVMNRAAALPSLGSSALWYASIGWPVFPLFTPQEAASIARRQNIPIDKVAKRPRLAPAHPKGDPLRGVCKGECGKLGHGLHDATTDELQIREWWGTTPAAGIGLATGHLFDVIDIDGAAGYQSLRELGAGAFPDIHGKVQTTREDGGEHWYVLATGDGNRAGVKPGIDYRGVGGYAVAPPTEINGRRYTWLVRPSPEIMGRVK